jgi:uncharacterized OsmC-like protein
MTEEGNTMTETLRERQAPLKERYETDPTSALKTFTIISSTTGDDPTRVQVRTAEGGDTPLGSWNVAAHPMAGGPDDLPCSGDLMLASLAACQEITIRMVATAMGITLSSLNVTIEGDMDFRGTMGVDRDAPVGFTAIRTSVSLTADAPADRLERLANRAEQYCVIAATLRNPPALTTTIETSSASDQTP